MRKKCKILDVFKTTLGDIAILGFSDNTIPWMGMILSDENNNKWKITRMGMNRKGEYVGDSDVYVSIWDCGLTSVDNTPAFDKDSVSKYLVY